MSKFLEALTVDDLVMLTTSLHTLAPSTKDYVVVRVEEPIENDSCVAFHLSRKFTEPGVDEIVKFLSHDYCKILVRQ